MNTCLRSFAFMVLTGYCCAAQNEPTAEYWQALRKGAAAKVTLKVAEQNGLAVSNANATVYFDMVNKNGNASRGSTDGEGLFSAEGLCADYAAITVTKQGYYDTRFRYDGIRSRDPERLKGGRWLPWNPTIPVVLREVRDPIPMYVKRFEGKFPNETVAGFDCEKGDFVEPHGSGKTADFFVHTKEMRLSAADRDGGFLVLPSHGNSAFKSDYLAPENGYATNLTGTVVTNERNGRAESVLYDYGDDYGLSRNFIVFKSRIKRDSDGKVVSANYGKIYGNFQYWRDSVKFLYYFNPTPNDRNLEFDGRNNLFKPAWNSKLNWSQEP